ncbi:hypothetical protein HJC23_003744 [Cyclotella cryptica]|uniref:dolichyl-diphosphooligosaccharide--protein glycotransferase n=1 Tax=Cyclotella cryptica TaxID=29204 RepID=A0ABD3QTV8_9STRA|eukprot:CCRYP_002149-RA/>CCRYP_002149-RA protein AED:0.09 eAED:0.09 QI:16/1/1/1/1/1/4/203/1086
MTVDPTPAKANKNGNGSTVATAQPHDSGRHNDASSLKQLLAAATRIALTLLLLYFAASYGYSLLCTAYDIRMHAIRTYGYIIHEFDPWFNFRATQYLHDNGWAKFATWYDYKVWYPLGRPVGTTIYPGMQVTAVILKKLWLPLWFGLRHRLGFHIPTNTVIRASVATEASGQSSLVAALATVMNAFGVQWAEMNLNDVCCLMPAWFGAAATLVTGLLACECSAHFTRDNQAGGSNFGTVLDCLPFLGHYIHKASRWIRWNLAYYSGLDVDADSRGIQLTSSCFQTTSLLCMLATMFFMSIVPAHLMRSVGGGFDNESVAVTAMTLVFYLWTRSLRDYDVRTKQDCGFHISPSTRSAFLWGSITGVAYFNMVAAWGGYVFVVNLVGLHAAILILLGRHSSKLHAAYSAFYLVGTALATRVPVVRTVPLRSLEQLGPMLVFVGMQLVEYCERVRTRDRLSHAKVWLLRIRIFGIAAVLGAAVVGALWPTGYFGPISARVRGLFVKHTKTGNPLVDSVAEHQAASPAAYEQYLLILTKLAPIGFGMVAIGFTNDASSFLLVYGVATYFFSHKMVRLILLTAPIASVFGGIVVGRVVGMCVEGICGWRLDAVDILNFLLGRREKWIHSTLASIAPENGDAPKSKKKKKDFIDKGELKSEAVTGVFDKPSIPNNYFFQLVTRAAWFYLAYYIHQCAEPYKKPFEDKCRETSYGLSHPTILFQANTGNGQTVMVDDYREAYWWLRDNTPEDARIMAWWDYGYQITGIANRTTIADGNTWNHEHIALLGRALTSPLKEGHRIARHLADYLLLWTGGGGDDLAKSPHLARIANSVYRHMCPGDPTCSSFGMIAQGVPSPKMQESLLYRLHSNGIVPGVEVDKNRFKEVYKSKYGKVRIYKILSVSKESKEWVPENLVCDAPGSWFCKGQYPPGLQKVLSEKKDFKQLEDFNSKTEADDEYQRKYFEHLSDPEKAKRRAEVRARKQLESGASSGKAASALTKEQINKLNQKWEDTDITSRLFNIIHMGDYESLEFVLENQPSYAHVRSKDGRGPMWWAHEHGRKRMVSLLKSFGVSEKLRDKDGIIPLDISEDEL